MFSVYYHISETYEDMPESTNQAIEDLDKMLCEKLGLDYENIPDFNQ